MYPTTSRAHIDEIVGAVSDIAPGQASSIGASISCLADSPDFRRKRLRRRPGLRAIWAHTGLRAIWAHTGLRTRVLPALLALTRSELRSRSLFGQSWLRSKQLPHPAHMARLRAAQRHHGLLVRRFAGFKS